MQSGYVWGKIGITVSPLAWWRRIYKRNGNNFSPPQANFLWGGFWFLGGRVVLWEGQGWGAGGAASCFPIWCRRARGAGLCKSSATRGEVPPRFDNFRKLGGRRGGEFFSKIMPHFGLIKLEFSNLLDITIIDGYIVLHITNLQNMAYIVGCKIVTKSCRSKIFWDLLYS